MKRSEINQLLREAIKFFDKMDFKLPPFAFWSPQDWKSKGHEFDEIRGNKLGWDVTDFGSGQYTKIGLTVFTIRNGNMKDMYKYPKTYCEKVLFIGEEQVTPLHYHWSKMEDIINRGGGNLLCQVYNATRDDKLADTPVRVVTEGRHNTVPAGSIIRLNPGESITLYPKLFHSFWAEKDNGSVLSVEVSKLNDDLTDNNFYGGLPRFPKIEEDEEPLYFLCTEYPLV
jgi:D-lyxose ketol-isomerase